MIECFGPMYIDFDEYPCYSGRNSEILKEMLMKTYSVTMCMHILQVNRKYPNGLVRTVDK